jgi:cholesterol transport system auxiliary component
MRRCALLALSLCVALAGCGGLFQTKARPLTMYQLTIGSAAAAATPPPQIPVDLAVLKPRMRTGLTTDRIAALYPDRRLEYFADARWSGPLEEVIQDLALQAFHANSRLRNVSAEQSEFPGGYFLEIEVSDFQAEYSTAAAAPTVHVHLLARLGNVDRRILAQFEASAVQTAAENRLGAIVEAYNQAADAALAQIVAGTVQALAIRAQQDSRR